MTDLRKDYPEIAEDMPAKTFDELVSERTMIFTRAMGLLIAIHDCTWFAEWHRGHAKELVDAYEALTEQIKKATP